MSVTLLTGASGAIGTRLAPRLLRGVGELRCLLRHPEATALPAGAYPVRGDVVTGEGLHAALAGVDTAYYLVNSMGGRGGRRFAARDRRAAANFAAATKAAGVRRVIYLGGLSSSQARASSEHLRSREEVAALLAPSAPEFVHVRAAMVIGAGGASFEMLRALVRRLPAMVCPRWVDTRTQPIAIDDVVDALVALRDRHDVVGDVELGGPEVLSYREMMKRAAPALGRHAPLIVRVPVLTPRLSSYWVMLVTPVDGSLVRPLVDGMREQMVVHHWPPRGINDHPQRLEEAVRVAVAER
jgi:uncharacterized protein YbjT (DUF2867 family)